MVSSDLFEEIKQYKGKEQDIHTDLHHIENILFELVEMSEDSIDEMIVSRPNTFMVKTYYELSEKYGFDSSTQLDKSNIISKYRRLYSLLIGWNIAILKNVEIIVTREI